MERLEKIEKLRERAQVSYDEAKEALEVANGDLLDALIYLEEQGKVKPPSGDGYFRSQADDEEKEEEGNYEREESKKQRGRGFEEALESFWDFICAIVTKLNQTHFQIETKTGTAFSMPLTVLVVLAIFLPGFTLPALIIGFFLGYFLDYRFKFIDSDKS
ncbi:DUF4342 domain-containing protein [Candidatus Darwinibacter acetoxidans]